ncbi:Tip elongation aberrant protein Tea4 [Trichoderma ghanense]|uniref:Tip elongation aberrant protein Tea4 n=1 Tax=Trichoderma ghanense TaxID=65468 RepID=A0ABY2HD98_9HYPO
MLSDHSSDRALRPSRNPFSSPPVLLAPHQAETLRDVAHESSREHARSPWAAPDTDHGRPNAERTADGMDVYQQHQQDSLAVAQNGSAADDDIEDDGDLDDDMMDRISSSPSIEDGACSSAVTPVAWPRRVSSLSSIPRTPWTSLHLHASPHSPSPTPAPSTPDTDFLHQIRNAHHHLLAGEYAESSGDDDENRQDDTQRRDPAVDEDDDDAFIQDPASHCVDTVEDETYEAECDCGCDCGCDNGDDLCAHQNEADTDDADLPLTIPYNKSFEDDDDSDFSLPDDPRFIDYGWAAECLHEPEDIDFEFVYALHTFVATVEGQANATKGDTMVLLDDSNSYWWLVRVVKDSSIGYLPAEHIETPTERLARLNKHRNIDLSASMLTDQQQPPKQKSGFSIGIKKKASVAFAEPTYHDYSDHDYSSEEEDADEASEPVKQKKQATSGDDEDATDESARVEPLKPNKPKTAKPPAQTQDDSSDDEDLRGSLDVVEKRDGPSISRNGNIRNTDSFFKDDTAETKKITLTPNLLRDDGPRESTDSMSSGKPRTSLDRLEKELMSDKDRKKSKDKDKREKDKKPGGLRGFFSRKDKKQSPDDRPEGESRDSEERHSEEHSSPEKPRQPAKLHKQQARVEPTVNNKAPQASTVELASYLAESRINDVSNVPPPSMRIVNPETNETQEVPSHQPPRGRPSLEQTSSPTTRRGPEVVTSPRAAAAPRALNHLDLSDSDESEDGDAILDRMPQPNSSTPIKTTKAPQDDEVEEPIIPGSFPESNPSAAADTAPVSQPAAPNPGARAHSVSPVSPVASSEPPALMVDTSSPDDRSPSASPSPELTQSAEDRSKSSSSSTGSKEQTWDDMKLHAFFNEPDHIRDLLVVVYDKTDVVPASSDHPVVGGLFREQNAKLAEITTEAANSGFPLKSAG